MELGKSLEDYLEAILMLHQKAEYVRSVDLARYMGFSKPSISHAVKILRDGGYLTVDVEGFLYLTNTGQKVAEGIYERHYLFREILTGIGVSRNVAEQDACRMKHYISEESFQKLKESMKGK